MSTAQSLNPESPKRSIEMGSAVPYPRKSRERLLLLWKIFWENPMLCRVRGVMNKLEPYFATTWGEFRKKSEERFWKDFLKKTSCRRLDRNDLVSS
jgi:hypothetical protein